MFINYTRDLRFDDRPDYGLLKRLIKTIAEKEKIEFDYNYDWVIRKNEEKIKQTQNEPGKEEVQKKSTEISNENMINNNETSQKK
jgi:hypothetical protein